MSFFISCRTSTKVLKNRISRFLESQTPHTSEQERLQIFYEKGCPEQVREQNRIQLLSASRGALHLSFPPTLTNVSIDCRSTSINVNHQTMENFPAYCKNLVQLHKWKISPEYRMVDIKCEGTFVDVSCCHRVDGRLGIEGTHNDVPSAVFDRPYVISKGDMVMEVKIDMNYQVLRNLPAPTNNTDAATKQYVDTAVKTGRTMTGRHQHELE